MLRARVGVAVAVVAGSIGLAACGGGKNLTPNAGTTGTATTGTFLGKGAGENASAGDVPDYTPTGQLVADNGFRPDKNGFPFENYTNDGNPQNLRPADVAQLFGDQVCSSGSGDSCQLTPPAQQWMDESNKSMAGGHCEGFSIASIRMYKGTLKPDEFGAGDPFGLQLQPPLQTEIAKGFVTQDFPAVKAAVVEGDPNQVLDKLTEVLKSKSDYYTIGIYKFENGGRTGGHAVTPYAIEDKGDGKMNVLIYDNNYPGKTRMIQFDRNADTWSYDASTNPNNPAEAYKGDAQTKTIDLAPESVSEGQQPCPFCDGQGGGQGSGKGSKGTTLPSSEQYNQISLEGSTVKHAHLLLSDDRGHKTGYDGEHFVQDIPGSQVVWPKADRDWLGTPEPSYRVPVGTKVTVVVDGSGLAQEDTENVTLIGPGIDAVLDHIQMAPGEKDELTFNGEGSGYELKTDPKQTDAPILAVGFTADSGDYGFAFTPLELAGGSRIAMNLDKQAGRLKLDTSGTHGKGTYALAVVRQSEQGEQQFKHEHLQLASGQTGTLEYSHFTQAGQPIKLDISGNGQNRSEELSPDQG